MGISTPNHFYRRNRGKFACIEDGMKKWQEMVMCAPCTAEWVRIFYAGIVDTKDHRRHVRIRWKKNMKEEKDNPWIFAGAIHMQSMTFAAGRLREVEAAKGIKQEKMKKKIGNTIQLNIYGCWTGSKDQRSRNHKWWAINVYKHILYVTHTHSPWWWYMIPNSPATSIQHILLFPFRIEFGTVWRKGEKEDDRERDEERYEGPCAISR